MNPVFHAIDLNIKLENVEPPVWRLLRISERSSFAALHRSICVVFGWPDSSAHHFSVRHENIGPVEKGRAFANERKITLGDRISGKRFRAQYNYGEQSEWQLEITLAGREEVDREPDPEVRAGARKSPPAHVEGPVDYAALVDALGDPSDPDHETAKELLGTRENLEQFQVEHDNARLKTG